MYTTLLMSTGLTFGTIASLFGRSHGIIDSSQYSTLVAAIIGTAIIPTIVANTLFLPSHLLPRPEPEMAPPRSRTVLGKVVHANDGSEHAFHALAQALAIAKLNNSELHMVSVEKIGYVAESAEQVTEGTIQCGALLISPPNSTRTCSSSGREVILHFMSVWLGAGQNAS
jgi:hypothetical protein